MRPDGTGGPHVFVVDLEHPELRAEDRRHLTKSLRLGPGDAFTVSDGAGSWRACRFGSDPGCEVEPDGPVVFVPAPRPPVTIGFALIKGGRPELVVQKLTELGVDTIVPFVAERSVVRWKPDRVAHHTERLHRVAREAAMQSRRVRLPEMGGDAAMQSRRVELPEMGGDAAMQSRRVELPEVEGVAHYVDLAALPGAIRADIGGDPLTLDHPVVLIGPEGGWSDAERSRLGAVRISSSVLRAETAAITAAALLTALRDGLTVAVR